MHAPSGESRCSPSAARGAGRFFWIWGSKNGSFSIKKRKFVGWRNWKMWSNSSEWGCTNTQSWKVYRARCSLPRQFLNAIPSVCLFPHFLFPRWILLKLHRFKALQKLCNSVKLQILKKSAGLKMAKSRFSQKISTGPREYPWTIWNFLKNSLSIFFECLHVFFGFLKSPKMEWKLLGMCLAGEITLG